jgi:hypothetical protein
MIFSRREEEVLMMMMIEKNGPVTEIQAERYDAGTNRS